MMLTLWISRGCSCITIGELVGTASLSSLILTIGRASAVPSGVLGILRQSFVMLHLCHSGKSYAMLSKMYSLKGLMTLSDSRLHCEELEDKYFNTVLVSLLWENGVLVILIGQTIILREMSLKKQPYLHCYCVVCSNINKQCLTIIFSVMSHSCGMRSVYIIVKQCWCNVLS